MHIICALKKNQAVGFKKKPTKKNAALQNFDPKAGVVYVYLTVDLRAKFGDSR